MIHIEREGDLNTIVVIKATAGQLILFGANGEHAQVHFDYGEPGKIVKTSWNPVEAVWIAKNNVPNPWKDPKEFMTSEGETNLRNPESADFTPDKPQKANPIIHREEDLPEF
jgi:hypothetical protein